MRISSGIIIFIVIFNSQISYSQKNSGDTVCFKTIHRNIHKAIPDITGNDNPVLDTIEFTGINPQTTVDVIVTIDSITHTWVGDLIISLTKDTITDTLLSRIGRTGGIGFGLSCDNLIGTKLSDTATVLVQNMTCQSPSGKANSTGSFRPKYPLGIFNQSNVNPNGKWVLKIFDWGGGDTGTLRAWTLKLQVCYTNAIKNNIKFNPSDFKLYQNFPDPFNPTTTISYSIPKTSLIEINVYDVMGRKIKSLVKEKQNAGFYEVSFDATNLSSSIYYYSLYADENLIATKKMILIR